MKRFVIGLAALLGLVAIASAQVVTTRNFPEGAQVNNVTPSADFTTGAAAISLTAISGKWNYICGFTVTTGGTTAATTPMVCHSAQAFSLTADGVIAHANSGMRIFVCSIVMIAAAAENISVVEGSGSACATGKIGVIGGTGGTMSVAATGGFSSVAAFPWISSSVAGNALCLDKSGAGNVSGVITYRGAP